MTSAVAECLLRYAYGRGNGGLKTSLAVAE